MILADGKTVKAKGCGQGSISGVGLHGDKVEVKLKRLLYVPGLTRNILSVSRITEDGCTVVFESSRCRIMHGETVIAVAKKSGGLYYL